MSDFFADDLLRELPRQSALKSAYDAQKFSADVGFDFREIALVIGKVKEEHDELIEAYEAREADRQHFEEELGDNFFALVNLCRWVNVDPEALLKANAEKYLLRCKFVEEHLAAKGESWKTVPLDEIYRLWKEAKTSGL